MADLHKATEWIPQDEYGREAEPLAKELALNQA